MKDLKTLNCVDYRFKLDLNLLLTIAEANKNGFTIDLNGVHQKSGYVSAYLQTQNSFNIEGAIKVLKFAKENNTFIGGWFNPDNGLYYFDAVKVFENLADCISFGNCHKQISIFNLTDNKEIKL